MGRRCPLAGVRLGGENTAPEFTTVELELIDEAVDEDAEFDTVRTVLRQASLESEDLGYQRSSVDQTFSRKKWPASTRPPSPPMTVRDGLRRGNGGALNQRKIKHRKLLRKLRLQMQ